MVSIQRIGVVLLLVGVAVASNCTSPQACTVPADCRNGGVCRAGYCIASAAGPTGGNGGNGDGLAPSFKVTVLGTPNYGSQTSDFSVPQKAWRKDDTVMVRVESTATDVNFESIELTAAIDDPSVKQTNKKPCAPASSGCAEFAVSLGSLSLADFVGTLRLSAVGSDVSGNRSSSTSAFEGLSQVTRLNWARRFGPPNTILYNESSTPAVDRDGTFYVTATDSSARFQDGGAVFTPGVTAIRKNGTFATEFSENGFLAYPSIQGSAALSEEDAGTSLHFVAVSDPDAPSASPLFVSRSTSKGPLREVKCASAFARTVAQFAMLGSDEAVVATESNPARVLRMSPRSDAACTGSVPSGSSLPFREGTPTNNTVTDGTNVYWVDVNGALNGVSLAGQRTLPIGDAGTFNVRSENKLALFTIGLGGVASSRLTDIGAGGRLKSFAAAGIGWTTAFESTSTAAPVVLSGNRSVTVSDTYSMTNSDCRFWSVDAAGSANQLSSKLAECSATQLPRVVAGADNRVYGVHTFGGISVVSSGSRGARPVEQWQAYKAGLFDAIENRWQDPSFPTISCNYSKPASNTGILAFTTVTGWLVTYIVDAKGLDPTAPWPKYQHDVRNTGNVNTPIERCP